MLKRAVPYGVAVLSVIVALLVRLGIAPALGDRQPFATFYLAVAVSAWYVGLRPALVALVLGCLAGEWFFIPPRGLGALLLPTVADRVGAALYVSVGAIIAVLAESTRTTERRAEERTQAAVKRAQEEVLRNEEARLRSLVTATAEETQARLAAIVESSEDAIVGKTLDGIVTSWNAAAERLFGYRADEMIGRPISQLVPPDRPDDLAKILGAIRRGERVEHYDTERIRKDGRRIAVSLTVSPVKDASGRIMGASKIARDVTLKRQAAAEREQLLAATEQARAEAEAANVSMRRVQRIVDVAIADLPLDELLGEVLQRVREALSTDTAVILLRRLGEERPDEANADSADVLRVRAAVGLEEEAQRETRVPIGAGFAGRIAAQRRPMVVDDVERGEVVNPFIRLQGIRSLAGVPLIAGNRLIGVLHVGSRRLRHFDAGEVELLRLASDRVALAIERAASRDAERAAKTAAEAANRAKDEFLSVVSHELRTPLTSMTNWLHLLRTAKDDRHRVRAIASMERSVQAQTKLVEDLLDVSRIVTGRLRLDFGPVDLRTVIRAAFESIMPAAEAKDVHVDLQRPSTPVVVAGDADRLQQIVWNLLSNAVKFTPSGGNVDVRLVAGDGQVRLIVCDTGCGMDASFLPHAFERFQQAVPAHSRRHGGLGLGLAIVRHLTELHGGTVAVDSAGEGQGTTFTISLLTPERMIQQRSRRRRRLDGLRILVVDDDTETCELLRELLEGRGARVTTAFSARDARAAVAAGGVDVVVSDIRLPDEDGYALVRALRALNRSVPAIALTAYFAEESRARALAAGYQGHLTKPVAPDDLIETIVEVVDSTAVA